MKLKVLVAAVRCTELDYHLAESPFGIKNKGRRLKLKIEVNVKKNDGTSVVRLQMFASILPTFSQFELHSNIQKVTHSYTYTCFTHAHAHPHTHAHTHTHTYTHKRTHKHTNTQHTHTHTQHTHTHTPTNTRMHTYTAIEMECYNTNLHSSNWPINSTKIIGRADFNPDVVPAVVFCRRMQHSF